MTAHNGGIEVGLRPKAESVEFLDAVAGATNGLNLQPANGSPLVTSASLTLGSSLYQYIDVLIPALIGLSVLVSAMCSLVSIPRTWKRDDLFRQPSLPPLTRAEWLPATLRWYAPLAVAAARFFR